MTDQERDLTRRWVETWRVAEVELDAIRRQEIANTDTCEAVRQIFGSSASYPRSSAAPDLGLGGATSLVRQTPP